MKTAMQAATESLWRNMHAARRGDENAIASLFLLYGNPDNPPRLCCAAFDALCGLGLIEVRKEGVQ